RRAAGEDLAHRLEDDRADGLPCRAHKLFPVRGENRRDPVADLGTDSQHALAPTQPLAPVGFLLDAEYKYETLHFLGHNNLSVVRNTANRPTCSKATWRAAQPQPPPLRGGHYGHRSHDVKVCARQRAKFEEGSELEVARRNLCFHE